MNCELVYVWRKLKKNKLTRERHSLPIGGTVVGKEKHKFVSYRGRVTKVAPECLRKASVAEQMSWHITTKEKTLFEHALDEENLSW